MAARQQDECGNSDNETKFDATATEVEKNLQSMLMKETEISTAMEETVKRPMEHIENLFDSVETQVKELTSSIGTMKNGILVFLEERVEKEKKMETRVKKLEEELASLRKEREEAKANKMETRVKKLEEELASLRKEREEAKANEEREKKGKEEREKKGKEEREKKGKEEREKNGKEEREKNGKEEREKKEKEEREKKEREEKQRKAYREKFRESGMPLHSYSVKDEEIDQLMCTKCQGWKEARQPGFEYGSYCTCGGNK